MTIRILHLDLFYCLQYFFTCHEVFFVAIKLVYTLVDIFIYDHLGRQTWDFVFQIGVYRIFNPMGDMTQRNYFKTQMKQMLSCILYANWKLNWIAIWTNSELKSSDSFSHHRVTIIHNVFIVHLDNSWHPPFPSYCLYGTKFFASKTTPSLHSLCYLIYKHLLGPKHDIKLVECF